MAQLISPLRKRSAQTGGRLRCLLRKDWVTLESGTHVNLEGSRVTAGPAALKGKPLPDKASNKLAASRAGGKAPEKSPPSGQARKSKAKVTMDDNSAAANANWKELAGGVPTTEIASMVGAPDDAKMDVYMGNGSALIDVDHPDYTAERIIGKDDSGDTYIKNSKFFLKPGKEKGTGLGSKVFSDQVANLSETAGKTGIKYIQCSAARDLGSGKQANGYYTWPRMGYDQSLSDYTDATPAEKEVLSTAAKKFNASSVLDVMATSEGREWWKENGCDLRNMKFDLAKDSRSMRIHHAYLDERKSRGPTAKKKSLTGNSQGHDIEEIELSDDDEAALDAAWKKMGERQKRLTGAIRKDWHEDQHSRDRAGKFGSGGGSVTDKLSASRAGASSPTADAAISNLGSEVENEIKPGGRFHELSVKVAARVVSATRTIIQSEAPAWALETADLWMMENAMNQSGGSGMVMAGKVAAFAALTAYQGARAVAGKMRGRKSLQDVADMAERLHETMREIAEAGGFEVPDMNTLISMLERQRAKRGLDRVAAGGRAGIAGLACSGQAGKRLVARKRLVSPFVKSFDESKVTRADDGKFGSGGSSKPQGGDHAERLAEAGDKLRDSAAPTAKPEASATPTVHADKKANLADHDKTTSAAVAAAESAGEAFGGHLDDVMGGESSDDSATLRDDMEQQAYEHFEKIGESAKASVMAQFGPGVDMTEFDEATSAAAAKISEAIYSMHDTVESGAEAGDDADDFRDQMAEDQQAYTDAVQSAHDEVHDAIFALWDAAESADGEHSTAAADAAEELNSDTYEDDHDGATDDAGLVNEQADEAGSRYRVWHDEDEGEWVYGLEEDAGDYPGKKTKRARSRRTITK